MNDRDRLIEYARQVDELRRLHIVSLRPWNQHARRAIEEQEKKVDALTAKYLPREDVELVPPPSAN